MAAKKFKDLIPDVSESVKKGLRQAAVEIMNGLVESGPAYSGEFSSAWYALPPGQSPGGNRSRGKEYRYDLRNVPKSKFKELKPGAYYEIVNGMDYAPQALDLEEGRFQSQKDDDGKIIPPIKKNPVVEGGRRTGPIRGQVQKAKGGLAISTAQLDWYNNYIRGGGMERDLGQGVKLGFRDGPLGSKKGFG